MTTKDTVRTYDNWSRQRTTLTLSSLDSQTACRARTQPDQNRNRSATAAHRSEVGQTQDPREQAGARLAQWVESCPNPSEKRNWQHVADQMKQAGVYLNSTDRYVIPGDLFRHDFIGLVAPHCPLSLPDKLTVTGKLDLNFFSGLRVLPRGLRVGDELILTGIKDILNRTPHPILERGKIINAKAVMTHQAHAAQVIVEKLVPRVHRYLASR